MIGKLIVFPATQSEWEGRVGLNVMSEDCNRAGVR